MIDNARPVVEKKTTNSKVAEQFEAELIRLLRRHWLLLISTISLGVLLAGVYFFLAPPIYESSSQLLLLPKDASLAARGVEGSKDQNSTISQDMLATHMMLVQSPRIIKPALSKNGLAQLPSLMDATKNSEISGRDRLSAIASYIIDNLYVARGGKGQSKTAQVIQVTLRHSNAEDARQIVSAVVTEFEKFLNEKFRDVNSEAATIIERARLELEGSLSDAELKFRTFKEANPLLFNGEENTNSFRVEYEQLLDALTQLRLERSQKTSRLTLVEKRLKEITERKGSDLERLALIDENNAERVGIFLQVFAGDAQTAQFQAQQPARLEAARSEYEGLTRLKAQELNLMADYGPDHPELRLVREQIAAIEKFLNQKKAGLEFSKKENLIDPKELVDSYVSLLKHDIEASEERELQLLSQCHEAEVKAKSLVKFEMEGEALRLSATRQRQLYEATLDRLTEIGMARDYAGVINEVIVEAEVGREVWPSLPICLALGMLAGLVVGGGSVAFFEWRNRAFRTRQEIEEIVNAPILSLIPKILPDRRAVGVSQRNGSEIASSVHTFHSPQSQAAEVFRGLRTTLYFRAKESNAKVFAITSALSGDGKSTVVSNLCVSIAQSGRRVLLIDSDLRRPSLAKIFGLKNTMGLTDFLNGSAPKKQAIIESEIPNLSIITSGTLPNSPAEVLESEAFKGFIDDARTEYDFIFLDCPPVLAVSDPCIVADRVDSVMVVLNLNPQSRLQVQRTINLLSDVNANILGSVINLSVLEEDRLEGTGQYGLGYGYGTHDNKTISYFNNTAATVSKPQDGKSKRTKRI